MILFVIEAQLLKLLMINCRYYKILIVGWYIRSHKVDFKSFSSHNNCGILLKCSYKPTTYAN